jgi:predicted phage terminase large subunit-like protein
VTAAPLVLLPYQQRWIAEHNTFRVCVKGRRIGITWAQAADDVLYAATAGNAKHDVYYIGYNEKMTREYIDTAADWARAMHLAASEVEAGLYEGEESILTLSIKFRSGNEIMALSSAPRNLRGKQGRIVIDEAAHHDDLAGLIKAAVAMKIWGGETVIISTHEGEKNRFNRLVEDIRAGVQPGVVHQITFDDAIAEGLDKRIFYVLGEEWTPQKAADWRQGIINEYGGFADEELFCIPSTGTGGGFFDRTKIEMLDAPPACSVRVRAWDRAASEPSKANPDPDWTVGLLLGQRANGNPVILDVVRGRLNPGGVEDLTRSTAEQDGRDVTIWQWQDPGAAGKADAAHYQRSVLQGYTLKTEVAAKAKTAYAGPPSSACAHGNLAMVRAPWNNAVLAVLEAFPSKGQHDDDVDALSLAYLAIAGGQDPTERLKRLTTGAMQ